MTVAIFGKHFKEDFRPSMLELMECFQRNNIEVTVYAPFYQYLQELNCLAEKAYETFEHPEDIESYKIDFFFSLGGDGTFLKSLPFLKNFSIPIVGVNSGRLGFLANISREEISKALQALINKDFRIEMRNLLSLEADIDLPGFNPVALNEFTVQKSDSEIISVNTYINNEFLNTYWTDGLIVATPTGSTAYSLSIGGPIVTPGSHCNVIAPIASHNLSVRPLVVHEDQEVRLEVRSRTGAFLLTADNQTIQIKDTFSSFHINKSSAKLRMVKFLFNNYYLTLREKLMWGSDKRNW